MLTRLRQLADGLTHDVHAMWLAARDPRTPFGAKALGVVVAGYALSPIDLIPDFVPVLGLLDDLLIVAGGIWLFVRMVPAPVMIEARATALAADTRPGSHAATVVIVLVWLVVAGGLAWQFLGFTNW